MRGGVLEPLSAPSVVIARRNGPHNPRQPRGDHDCQSVHSFHHPEGDRSSIRGLGVMTRWEIDPMFQQTEISTDAVKVLFQSRHRAR